MICPETILTQVHSLAGPAPFVLKDTMTDQDRNISSSFAKGLAVLAVFDAATPTLTLAEIARRTGQDRATARRGALTLVQAGYLRQQGRVLSLTPKVLALSGGFLQANHFGRKIQPVLNRHAASLDAEITLATLDQGRVLLLAQSTVEHAPITYGFTAGAHIPLVHTSLGRMLMACLTVEDAAEVLAHAEIPRHTEQSLTEPAQILSRVSLARERGYAVTDSEFETGIVGYAVPVSRPGQTPIVVGSSSPRGVTPAQDTERSLRALQVCAAELRQSQALAEL
ncbi:beta-ketoadipate pathway transcriptional regulator, PcaR/PcaU/PobR family [Ruegeria sp. R11]|jgi:IclR family pca regulon transcriptional regulator|uniref:Pca regulon regulatory protein n=2 Tax=Phaeobacter italicus TaxID=481446 RepID=A0A0H5DE58_9RHOB|nr:beta-ketoadipate pathway transcriptional regulator, PcaR/PcaU/PobR family [Ruegeria sp. R11]NKX41614.1 helix-turn-helix domain-containing protein [Rhodobacteraceae bacterium R_SAG2]CRL10417.1 Pca regulon regulatory protein [Phaeobacter italicus]CRL15562.1 Pca regulon regulatory protein [Phaeobacter italicus]SFG48079.1 transcriptional regulator, IclR family [Phaeobacter italicus]